MTSATDIITYIGIPLAVLGVLPILYTFLSSLLTTYHIRKTLTRNSLPPTTRSSLISGIVEVALPRCTLTPLDRTCADFWQLNPRPSTLRGGTWTIFKWNRMVTGQRLYRVQYSDELQEPQAEIDFEELLAFLLDRGAVPDVKGLHMLRVSGLWTPTGTSLLLSPDTTESVLRVSMPDDSDGILSLAIHWRKSFDHRDPNSLPPSWIRLSDPVPIPRTTEVPDLTSNENLPVYEEKASVHPFTSLRFHLGHRNNTYTITSLSWESLDHTPLAFSAPAPHLTAPIPSLWFTSTAIALTRTKNLPLWTSTIPPSLRPLATHASIPCGVLVLLGLIPSSEAPEWETTYDPLEDVHKQQAKSMALSRAMTAERALSGEMLRAAQEKRRADESWGFHEDFMKRLRRDKERENLREREALGSGAVKGEIVAERAVRWFVAEGGMEAGAGLAEIVEEWLLGMVREEAQAVAGCEILERWRVWSERGGLNKEDLGALKKEKRAFCYAACVMGLLANACAKEESSVALDMQECTRVWKNVRVG